MLGYRRTPAQRVLQDFTYSTSSVKRLQTEVSLHCKCPFKTRHTLPHPFSLRLFLIFPLFSRVGLLSGRGSFKAPPSSCPACRGYGGETLGLCMDGSTAEGFASQSVFPLLQTKSSAWIFLWKLTSLRPEADEPASCLFLS